VCDLCTGPCHQRYTDTPIFRTTRIFPLVTQMSTATSCMRLHPSWPGRARRPSWWTERPDANAAVPRGGGYPLRGRRPERRAGLRLPQGRSRAGDPQRRGQQLVPWPNPGYRRTPWLGFARQRHRAIVTGMGRSQFKRIGGARARALPTVLPRPDAL
jgi:hypothetical protein